MSYSPPRPEQKVPALALGRSNYLWMLISVVQVVVGYLLMQGGASTDPNIFSARRITVAPIVVLTGYGLMFYGLLKRP